MCCCRAPMGRYTTSRSYGEGNTAAVAIEDVQKGTAQVAEGMKNYNPDSQVDLTTIKTVSVSGSTAGAGSGDFHAYRNVRRREMMRCERLEAAYEEKQANEEYDERVDKRKFEMEEKAKKKREKRQRLKKAKKGGKAAAEAGSDDGGDSDKEGDEPEAAPRVFSGGMRANPDTFKAPAAPVLIKAAQSAADAEAGAADPEEEASINTFNNDGSFMAKWKAMQAEK